MAEVQLNKPETVPQQNNDSPPSIDDFVEPNKMIQPWMLPYLPKGAYYREAVFDLFGGAFCASVGLVVDQIKPLEFLGVAIVLGGGLFLCNGWWTILAAGVLYVRAKKKYREAQKMHRNSPTPKPPDWQSH